MADEKVYTPEVIEETPFPTDLSSVIPTTQSQPAGTFANTISKEKPMPKKRVAVELLSTVLNTVSRKILGAFELVQQGAIQIGNFAQGISGDIRITPNGITARDKAGNTTFNIDGDTGDAQFKGEIRAGSIITEGRIVNSNGVIIADEHGLTSSAFNFDTVFSSTIQNIDGTTTDLTDMSLTLELTRSTKVVLLATCVIDGLFNTTGSNAALAININGTDQTPKGVFAATHGSAHNTAFEATLTTHKFATLGAGTHTIKLRGTDSGGDSTNFKDKQLTFFTLGI